MEHGIHVELAAQTLGTFLGLPITNSLIMTWLVMMLLFVFVFFVNRSIKLVPGKLQATLEMAVEGGFNYVKDTFEDQKLAERFFPLIAGLAVFIAFLNEVEFFPGVGSIGVMRGEEFIPFLRAGTSDLNTTLALTLISVITIEVAGIMALGFFKYGGKFIAIRGHNIGEYVINFVVGIIELISEVARLVTFSFRLFGNIFAGEVLVAIVGFFVPYVLPAPFILFEMFVGLVQGVIFALLTLFFIKLAVTPVGDH